jgi:hypothetical protein
MLVMLKLNENICLPGNNSALQSTLAHETSFFSWTTVQKSYHAMPDKVTLCKDIYEAKMYTAALLAVFTIVFLPLVLAAYWIYCSAKKGGLL